MSQDVVPVTIKILGKEYRIACHPNEREALLNSALQLDERMKEVRDSGAVGQERIAVMVALNLAHELRQYSRRDTELPADTLARLRSMHAKIDAQLETGEE